MWITDQKPEEHRQIDIWVQLPDGNGKRVPDVMRSGNDYLMFCTLGSKAPKVPYSRYLIEQGATVTAWMPVPMPPQQG